MIPDRWLTLHLTLRDPAPLAREALSEFLLGLGGGGVEEVEDGLVTYLPEPENPQAFLARIRHDLARAFPHRAPQLSWKWQPHQDWERIWKEGLGPRQVTPRIVVAPSWDLPTVGPDQILITMDPGMAFGTAEHATTRGCLRLLDRFLSPGQEIADVGSGSGILSIAAARLGARSVVALEVDPMACEAARENLQANGAARQVSLRVEALEPGGVIRAEPLHGIVANIQTSVLGPLLPTFRENLVLEGWLILSGILREERDTFLPRVESSAFRLEAEDAEELWWTAAFRPTSPGP